MKTQSKKKTRRFTGRYAAKLTSKYQATIPKEIRTHLHLESGDLIIYELLQDGTITLQKSSTLDVEYLMALNETMNEWQSKEDAQAYENL